MSLSVSKGTYIRTLIADAAERLGTLGVMTALERTKACGFDLSQCISVEQAQELADKGELTGRLMTLDSIFEGCPRVRLSQKHTALYKNGVKLRPEQLGIKKFDKNSRFLIISDKGVLISAAYIDVQKNEVRSLRNFY